MAAEATPAPPSTSFQLILGSSSVARRKILAEMGYKFDVMTANIDEKSIRREKPEELVLVLAEAKVRTTARKGARRENDSNSQPSTHNYNLRSENHINLVSDSMAAVPGASDLKEIKDMLAALLKRQDAQDQKITTIQAHLAELDSRIIIPEDTSESTGAGNKGPMSVGAVVPPRYHRVEFPLFDGSDEPLEWLCRCEQYFRGQRVPEEEKVWLAAYHMIDVAQQWYYKIERSERIPNWLQFKEACQLRFGPPFRSNPIVELSLLKQSGSVEEYTKDFYRVFCRTDQLTPTHEIGLFLAGLSEIIWTDVEMQNPISLETTVSLARASERHYQILWGSGFLHRPQEQLSSVQPIHTTSILPKPPKVPLLPAPPRSGPDQRSLRSLTPAEMAERRQKGLCFNCDEFYTRGHKCKRLFWLEVMDDEQVESSLMTANETPNKYG